MTNLQHLFTILGMISIVLTQNNDINFVYSPFYLNNYILSSDEGTSLVIKVAKNVQAVYFSSGFGGIIVLDQIGSKKLLQQQFKQQGDAYISTFDVSSNGNLLIIGINSTLSIYQYPQDQIHLKNMTDYKITSTIQVPSQITNILYFESQKIIFVTGLQGYISVYDTTDILNPRLLDTYNTQSVQITQIQTSSDAQWVYLSCDIVGVIVLKLDFIPNSNPRQAHFTKAAYGNGYRKTWSLVVTSDNKYIYEIENWFGIFYADNSQTLAANSSTYPIQLNFQAYWPFQYINPVCTIIFISNDNNFIFVGVRSIGILIFDISHRENIQFFQHIQIDGLSNSAVLSGDEKYLYYANSLSIQTFQQSSPNLNNNFPNIFNAHQALQKQMDGIYKWRCYTDPTNQYLMGSFDYSGTYMIPFYNNPLNLQIQYAAYLKIESDSMSFDTKNNLLFIPSLYSNKLITVFSIQPTSSEPNISLTNPKEVSSFSVDTYQMAEQLIFSKDRQYAIQTYQSGIILFNMTNPFNISQIYYYASPDFMQGETGGGAITDDNNYIIACCRNYGIYVLDCVDKSNIYLSDYLETLGAESITLSKISTNYGYLMDGIRGFAILDLTALPKIKILSRTNIQGWTQLGIPIKQDRYILIGSQDIGMLTLVDIQDKANPNLIATYLRDKQFSVAICTTKDEDYVFITNPQGIITMPLKSQVYIHTEVSVIIIDQLTGDQSIQQYKVQNGQSKYIFQVGQQVQLNFVMLYPQNEDVRIVEVSQYLNGQVVSLPFYMQYQLNTQTLTMDIDKSALGNVRQGMNQNILLIKTVIPLQVSQFQYNLQDQNDIVSTDLTQASLILNYLVDQNYLDSKQAITDFFDSTKPFKFNNDFIMNFKNLQSSTSIQNVQLFIQQLEQKVLQTLILSYYINPVVYYVEPSLYLSFINSSSYIYSLSTSLISMYLQIDNKIGKFVTMNYPGVITSFSLNGDQIKLEGSLSNINSVLQNQIIFFNSSQLQSYMQIQIQLSDNYNYPFVLDSKILECPLIVLKQQIKINSPLQQQVEKQFKDSIVEVQSQITLVFSQNTFIVNDTQQITYKLQLFNPSTQSYEDISADFWLQSQGQERLNYFGTIPSKYFNSIFKFKIIANDSYTFAEDYFILKAYGISIYYLLNLLAQVLGPLIAVLSIYKKRSLIWNILFKSQTQFEDEYAYVGKQYCKQIILMGDNLKDSIQLVNKLFIKLNKDQKIKQNYAKISRQRVSLDPQETRLEDFEANKKIIQMNNTILSESIKNFYSQYSFVPKSFTDKIIKKLAAIPNHKRKEIIEYLYLNKCGNVNMQSIIQDILNYKLNLQISNTYISDEECIKQLYDVNSKIHIAIKSSVSRRLLLLDKKSQQVYDILKQYAIKYYWKQNKYWYRAFVEIKAFSDNKQTESVQIFSSLRIKVQEIKNLFVLLEILPQQALSEVNDFSSLLECLHKYKTGINMYLIRDCLYADTYGLNLQVPGKFHLAQGESIHLNHNKIKQIQAYTKVNKPQILQKCGFMLNQSYKKYVAYKNIRLPTWINLEYKNGVIRIQGIPTTEDIEDILIRIYDNSGYIVKSFVLKVLENPSEKQNVNINQQEEENINSINSSVFLSNQIVLCRSLSQNKKSVFSQSQFYNLVDMNSPQNKSTYKKQ